MYGIEPFQMLHRSIALLFSQPSPVTLGALLTGERRCTSFGAWRILTGHLLAGCILIVQKRSSHGYYRFRFPLSRRLVARRDLSTAGTVCAPLAETHRRGHIFLFQVRARPLSDGGPRSQREFQKTG